MNNEQHLKAYGRSAIHLLLLGGAIASLFLKTHYVMKIIIWAAYGAGWELIPKSNFFRRRCEERDRRLSRAGQRKVRAQVHPDLQKSFDGLGEAEREKYMGLMQVAHQVEERVETLYVGVDDHEAFLYLRQIDRLMHTYMQLLNLARQQHNEISALAHADESAATLESDMAQLKQEISGLEQGGETETATLLAKRKTLESLEERLGIWQKRHAREAEMDSALEFSQAELKRIEELMGLLRADLVPTHDAESFSVHIDVSQQQIDRAHARFRELGDAGSPASEMESEAERLGVETDQG